MKKPKHDLSGKRFTRLTAIRFVGFRKPRGAFWECLCACGTKKTLRAETLLSGATQSCGCLNSDLRKARKPRLRHGLSKSRAWSSWQNMKTRCLNPKAERWSHYGGRGIKITPRWLESFDNFVADMGLPKPGQTLDRINMDGNYNKKNCRWANLKTQANNKKSNRFLVFKGKKLTVQQWAERLGVNPDCLYGRLNRGWTIEKTLSTK